MPRRVLKNAGVPVEANVAAIFLPTMPDAAGNHRRPR
jgi:hypothetical protein